MWRVYYLREVDDPKYGRRTDYIPVCEGSYEECVAYASNHPNTEVLWYCY